MSAGRDGAALLWNNSGAAPAGWRQQRLIGYSLSLPDAHEKHARLVPFVPDFPLCFVSHFHLFFSPPTPTPLHHHHHAPLRSDTGMGEGWGVGVCFSCPLIAVRSFAVRPGELLMRSAGIGLRRWQPG